jgi:LDH2 family malate/lactate/ureidoglycolate dehydrogenase
LVQADQRGIHTHGLALLPAYVEALGDGRLAASPRITVSDESGVIQLHANRALGQVAGLKAVEKAISASRHRGVVATMLHQTGHLGALGLIALRAAEAGLVAVLMQNTQPLIGLDGSQRPGIGNNPLAFAMPVDGAAPLVFDIAASEVALAKIIECAKTDRPIPFGWALDAAGEPTDDAQRALEGILLPFSSHKGLGLAMMVECFAGSLTGTHPMSQGGIPTEFGAFLLTINPDLVVGRALFDGHVRAWLSRYKASNPAARYPGERAQQMQEDSSKSGVLLPLHLTAALMKLGTELSIPLQ